MAAVVDSGMNTLFYGEPDKVIDWLLARDVNERNRSQRAQQRQYFQVYTNETRVTLGAKEYIRNWFQDQVLELVREAIDVQDPNAHACEITEKIVRLFE